MMPLQRAWDAESQVRNKLSNGPLRAQSNGISRVFCDAVGKRITAGDMLVSRTSAQVFPVNQGGTADSVLNYSSLTDKFFSVKGVFVF